MLDADPVIVMSNCIHNQLESLGQRYLKDTPAPGDIDVGLLLKIKDHLVNEICRGFKPEFNFQEYVRNKPGSVRRRFLKAYAQMVRGDRDISKNSKITAFVKNERYYEEGKSPRMIMGRDPKFNIIYCRFIARLEDAFFKLKQVANACDFKKCGEKFTDLFNKCSSMFENDMSKFEATQRDFLLAIEYLVYQGVLENCGCSDEIEDLKTVFAAKCFKPVVTGAGVDATFEWCRGSGDMDTSLGNGIINYVTTMYFMILNFCSKKCQFDQCGCFFDSFVLKGDDSYGCCPKNELVNYYAKFGLDAKLIYRPRAEEVEFCSGHFVRIADGSWYYVQKLRKLINSVSVCINRDIIKNGWVGHYLKSLGLMYKKLYSNIPIYEDFADMLITAHDKQGININLVENQSYGATEAFKNAGNATVDPCRETLLDISTANNMSFAELDALQRTFRSTKIDLPIEMLRRCNIKSTPDTTFVDDPGSLISTWVNRLTLNAFARRTRQMLDRLQQNPKQVLTKLIQNNKQR